MRQKGMHCQNLHFTSKLCCFMNFHSSSLGFTTHFVPCVSHVFCKFERNCLISFYFIWKSVGPVLFETACMSVSILYHHSLKTNKELLKMPMAHVQIGPPCTQLLALKIYIGFVKKIQNGSQKKGFSTIIRKSNIYKDQKNLKLYLRNVKIKFHRSVS